MHQRLIALALAAAMLLASCTATQTLPVPRERLAHVIDVRSVEVVNEQGERRMVKIKRVTPVTDQAQLDPETYHFSRYHYKDFGNVLVEWEQSSDWETADVTVQEHKKDSSTAIYVIAGMGIGLLAGVGANSGLDGGFTAGLMFMTIGGAAGGAYGASQDPGYRLAD